ncbi:MAG TPA: glutathione synthase, partial [Candidatus Dadabacteria bacterium]|nr:glutathione synthase [Candidatus Dadabacteria bacterium]
SSIDTEKDTTYLFMLECQNRDFDIYYSLIDELYFDSTLKSNCLQVKMLGTREIYKKIDYIQISVEEMDIVFMRKDPPVNLDYIHATYMLDMIKDTVLVVNNPTSLRSFNEKLVTLNFQDIIPPTIVTSSITQVEDFAKKFKDGVVIKPTTLCGGEGVFRYSREQEIDDTIIAQQFLHNVSKGDKRILLLNGEPIGAINRIAKEGSFICNFHAGGRPEKTKITQSDKSICDRIKPFLIKNGIYFAGIDVIDNMLTEINITSPTGLQEINQANNSRLETIVLDSILDKLK